LELTTNLEYEYYCIMKSYSFGFFLILFTYFDSISAQIRIPALYGFIENKGQFVDQHGKANNDILYLLRLKDYQIQIRKHGFSYEFIEYHYENKSKSASIRQELKKGLHGKQKPKVTMRTVKRIDVEFSGLSNYCAIVASDTNQLTYNYAKPIIGEKGINGVQTFKCIRFINFYQGIDLIYRITEEGVFKYDFVIKPGYNAAQIRWTYSGADSVKSNPFTLQLFAGGEVIEEVIPRSYIVETEEDVAVEFRKINDGSFGYKYPKSVTGTLNIDPFVRRVWSTYFGEYTDEVDVIEPAGGCGSYLLGVTTTDNLGTAGVFRDTLINPTGDYAWDTYLAKMNSSGSAILWFTYFGGKSDDMPHDMVVAQNGDIVICGTTASNTNVASSGAYRTAFKGPCEGFIARFNNLGQLDWSTYVGGDSFDYVHSLQMDRTGNIYFSGITSSPNIGKGTVFRKTLGGDMDMMLGKLTGDGKLIWLTYYGGELEEFGGWGGLVQRDSFLYSIAHTLSTSGIATTGSFQTSHGGNYDVFIVKFDTTGNLKWGTYLGGTNGDFSYNLSMDANRNLYLAGTTESNNFPTGGGYVHQDTIGGSSDGYVCSFTQSGALRWSSYYGGDDMDFVCGSKVNDCGDFALTGYTTSTYGIATPGSFDTIGNGGSDYDGFLAQFNDTGALIAGTFYGATDYTMSYAVNYDFCGRVITGGSSYASGLATSGTYQTTNYSTNAIVYAFDSMADCALVVLSEGFVNTKALRESRQRAKISWKYEGDIDEPADFEILRQGPLRFVQVGKTNAVKGRIDYSFTDMLPAPNGGFQYRIRYKGRQGQTELSKVFSLSGADGEEIDVYPNPAEDEILISWPFDLEQVEVFVADMGGRSLKRTVLDKANPKIQLNGLPAGFYVLTVVAGDVLKNTKIYIRRQN